MGNVWAATGSEISKQRWFSVGLRLLSPPLY